MPQIGLRHKFELETRNKYTKVDAEIGLSLDGKELPNTAILGDALDKAVDLIQEAITESYKEVPARDGTTPSPAPLPPRPNDPPAAQPVEPEPQYASEVPEF